MELSAADPAASSAQRQSADSSYNVLHWLLGVTTLIGVLVGLAPRIPSTIVAPALISALVVWSLLGFASLLMLFYSSRPSPADSVFNTIFGILGSSSIILSVLASIGLSLIQVVADRPALIWNVDWRAALSHAQAVSRFGNLEASLEYAGHPIMYHVGPAWLAGLFDRVFGGGIEVVLFGLIPLVSTIAILTAITLLLATGGAPLRVAVAAAGIAALLPGLDTSPLGLVKPDRFLNAETWVLGAGLMPNSYFALAVGLSAVALIAPARLAWWQIVAGILGVAATILLKPQYFVGLGLLIGLAGLAWLARIAKERLAILQPCRTRRSPENVGAPPYLVFAGLAGVIVLSHLLLRVINQPSLEPAIGAAVFAVVLVQATRLSVTPSNFGNISHMASASIALGLGAALMYYIPGHSMVYETPEFAPGDTGLISRDFASTVMLLFVATIAVTQGAKLRSPRPAEARCAEMAWLAMSAIALLSVGLQTVSLPIKPDLLEHASQLGTTNLTATSLQSPLFESIVPLRLIVAACCIGALVPSISAGPRRLKILFFALISLTTLWAAVFVARPLLHPDQGYEAAEDTDLKAVLSEVPVSDSVLVSSDIADPAQGYLRGANAPLLSAYEGHMMYLSELRWLNWVRADAPQRLGALRVFFGANWSPWHDAWLHQHGITHVLTSERCPPAWQNHAVAALEPISRHGKWAAFRVNVGQPISEASRPTEWSDISPRYGKSGCLRMNEAGASRSPTGE